MYRQQAKSIANYVVWPLKQFLGYLQVIRGEPNGLEQGSPNCFQKKYFLSPQWTAIAIKIFH